MPVPHVPPARALELVREFGAARGLELRALPPERPSRPSGLSENDAAIVDVIEAELEQARTALSALEEGAAGVRLSRVESQLLAHPHLPQAAFLMAECLALQAQAAAEASPAQSAALLSRRAALEGTRAPAFGETSTEPAALAPVAVSVQGLEPTDELELDGAQLGTTRRLQLSPGLHHARVWRRGRLIFATFSELAAEQHTLELAAPPLVSCSAEDLATGTAPGAPPRIACAHWAKVRSEPGGIGVALCEHSRCGAFVSWRARPSAPFQPLERDGAGMPAWAGFALAGAAVAVAGSLVLWQSGAFERGRPSAARWEYGGLNPQGLQF